MMKMLDRLKRLESNARRLMFTAYPPDDDGFLHAVCGDQAEQYRHGDGFDVMKALSDTAVQDWKDWMEQQILR